MGEIRRQLTGVGTGIVASVGLGAAMAPFRPQVSATTAALVLVLPVVVSVVVGGLPAGVPTVAIGFVVYDYGFVPPYDRLSVATGQGWVVIVVYAVVMLVVSRVVGELQRAQADAQRRTGESERLFELSELLVADRSVDELLVTIVGAVSTVFAVPAVALLVPEDGRLGVAASAGAPLTPDELHRLDPGSGMPMSIGTGPSDPGALQAIALAASGRPVGILAMRGSPVTEVDRALLRSFANHAALALERAQLRERALRTELLEEVDRLRHALMGAVSHDLRTPLASMKVASSTLLDPANRLSEADAHELASLIDSETDRLARLVGSLLDMTRLDAGALQVRRLPTTVDALVTTAIGAVTSTLGSRQVLVELGDDLPDVEVDQLLIGQVLANLLDNADRHAPPNTLITVAGEMRKDRVAVSVTDCGPGVPPSEREAVFDRFVRFDTGGRSGLGLSIAKTFVEAHAERIWVEDGPGTGARIVFTLTPSGDPCGRPSSTVR
ncbi:MAG: sensor histidine kinase [Acidimicrobiales bacterium]